MYQNSWSLFLVTIGTEIDTICANRFRKNPRITLIADEAPEHEHAWGVV